MGRVQVGPEGALKKESEELNYHMKDEHNGVRENGVLDSNEKRLSNEEEAKTYEQAQDVNDEANGVVRGQSQSGAHTPPQQQPVGPVVRWDRFLPFQSLKVLLVENDDSTRHVVSALLRNCGYEVYTTTNGTQAWKLLEDLTIRIDLVLTEAAMPSLSGIGLLCRIMRHKTRKSIPVIMMSSVDSMNLVFQCLSKGAADFLFKPVRKNELKNLWQHVWRRCHSSSGSTSESGVLKSKRFNESINNTGSNDENDNASIGLNVRDGSDNGSGTQSSWTKCAVEVESPQPTSPWKQPSEPHDSTCAQVIHPRPETFGNEWLPESSKRDITVPKELFDNSEMGRDLEIGMPTNSDLQLQSYPRETAPLKLPGLKKNKLLLQGLKKDKEILQEGVLDNSIDNNDKEERDQAADKNGAIASSDTICRMGVGPSETLTGPSMISEIKDKRVSDSKESPSLDLSLKRLRSIGDSGTPSKDERNVLRHSDQSAFSRYNTANSTTHAVTGCGGSCSVRLGNNSSEAVKPESVYNLTSTSDAARLNQGSNGSSNNIDMESTTKNVFTKPTTVKDKPTSKSASTCAVHTSSAFHSVQHWHSCPRQQVVPEKVNDIALAAAVGQPKGSHHQVQVQHHHYHYHHHRHHVHNMEQPPSQLLGQDDLTLNSMVEVAPQCGSSNVFGGYMENNGNYSLNGSVSGSNHGSNGQNGGSTAANNGAINVESDNGTAGKSGGGSGSGSGVEQNRSAQREAALTKFRQKRKERCYEKKVRYQSRKKLAEQRPRVRGQFVRHTAQEQTDQYADS